VTTATLPPAGLLASEWDAMSDAERADWLALAADIEAADQWADASRDVERLEWPALERAIRALGGINGLGQIAQCDMPGRLGEPRDARGRRMRLSAACAYDELGFALASAGLGDHWADMDGDAVLAELWRAWDAWDAAQHATRSDIVPDVAPPMPAEWTRDAASVNPGKDGADASRARQWSGHTSRRPEVESARTVRDVAPLPEPDAADADAYELVALFGAIGAADADAADAREAEAERATQRAAARADERARNLAAARRAVAEREQWERARRALGVAAPRRAAPPRLRVLPAVEPAPVVPSRRAHAIMVGAIVATFVTSAALLVALIASMCGATVPGIVWPLVLSLPAIGAGILPVALPAWQVPTVSLPVRVSVRVERRHAA
jgi:hypothetical protein